MEVHHTGKKSKLTVSYLYGVYIYVVIQSYVHWTACEKTMEAKF
jgi:hypothetical protein